MQTGHCSENLAHKQTSLQHKIPTPWTHPTALHNQHALLWEATTWSESESQTQARILWNCPAYSAKDATTWSKSGPHTQEHIL